MAAQADVRPPFARGRDARDPADDFAAGDEHAHVEAGRRNQRLYQRALRLEPAAAAERIDRHAQVGRRVAPLNACAPAAEARLDHGRRRHRRERARLGDVLRPRMRQACRRQTPGGPELVVRAEQRRRGVAEGDARSLQREHSSIPDWTPSIDRRTSIRHSAVSPGREALVGPRHGNDLHVDAERAPDTGDPGVRVVGAGGDDRNHEWAREGSAITDGEPSSRRREVCRRGRCSRGEEGGAQMVKKRHLMPTG